MSEKQKILFLCIANSARSQMAEGLLKTLMEETGIQLFDVYSAGTVPAPDINPLAVKVMGDMGISLNGHRTKVSSDWTSAYKLFPDTSLDYVVSLCEDNPSHTNGVVSDRTVKAYWRIPDPAAFKGSEEAKKAVFRQTAETIKHRLTSLLKRSEQPDWATLSKEEKERELIKIDLKHLQDETFPTYEKAIQQVHLPLQPPFSTPSVESPSIRETRETRKEVRTISTSYKESKNIPGPESTWKKQEPKPAPTAIGAAALGGVVGTGTFGLVGGIVGATAGGIVGVLIDRFLPLQRLPQEGSLNQKEEPR